MNLPQGWRFKKRATKNDVAPGEAVTDDDEPKPAEPPEFADRLRVLGANQLEAATVGVILGGRELPLILRHGTASGIPRLDTTQIHAKALVARAWS